MIEISLILREDRIYERKPVRHTLKMFYLRENYFLRLEGGFPRDYNTNW
ncbi:hypothetical protein Bcell_4083 [Evansella cellulosilytica DSM 2522]|uniref:Uncharacterized protein n=1 Tax=Evansella cellulosilytica (strain ATCC 21833 / DSM 2522 / FERM P-1141 / JCM 9156 / N-4) TaxID=649639 RepID=E6TXB8_EVAC2|nr:hypothetical protein Bcell_4083 [Evansella cellulosilytica DSM 2522]